MTSFRSVALALLLSLGAVSGAAAAPPTVTEDGYLTVSDGTRLRYHLVRPADGARHPVVLQYDGYSAGTEPGYGSIPKLEERLLERGFALLGVSIRGTGCSSGIHDLFEPQQAKDGAEAVEWAASRPWSNGRVGMAGYSFPGIMQLLTAAERPRGLRAIVPSSVVFDLYRDVAYPGSIANTAFGALFTEQQKLPGQQETPQAVAGGDAECGANYARHQAQGPVIAAQQAEGPYSDSSFGGTSYAARSAATTAARIDVPVLTSIYWQDEQTGSRVGGLLEDGGLLRTLDPSRTWVMLSNGNHDFNDSSPVYLDQMEAFLAHFVGGEENGFERTPKITQLHETSLTDGRPSWTSRSDALPRPEPVALHLRADGQLAATPGSGGEQSYSAPLPSSSTNPAPYDRSGDAVWSAPAPPEGRAVWTSPRLGSDLEVLGSASLDLQLVAGADDADLQATITEVRADGQEHYVQRGWLRASQRAIDPARSTPTRPWHPSRAADARPVTPGQPFSARLEVLPFGHTFRKGSAIRVVVDSPVAVTGNWGFTADTTPQRIRVLADGSRLVLGRVPGRAQAAPRACGDLRSLPCRPSIAPVPAGTLRLPESACQSRRTVAITVPGVRRGERLRRVSVTVDGRRVGAERQGRRVRVSLAGRPRTTVTVRVRATTSGGRTLSTVRRYRLCRQRVS